MSDRVGGTDRLECVLLNARSLVNKKTELQVFLANNPVDVVAITETWMTENHTDTEFMPAGYTVFRKRPGLQRRWSSAGSQRIDSSSTQGRISCGL